MKFSSEIYQDLYEFFQAEIDADLGRWRSREHPTWVVYVHENGLARVVNEVDGRADVLLYGPKGSGDSIGSRVAREYFSSHPCKGWQTAEVGEHWQIDVGNRDYDVTVVADERCDGLDFVCSELRCSIFHTGILAGRKIWPEKGLDTNKPAR